jgi:hypothetical protein
VCCVICSHFLTWLAAATNTTVSSAAIAVESNIYCRVPVNAILFANAAAVTAAIAELLLLLWALSLPLPLPLCGGLLQNSYCCHHRICQHHCYHYHGHCYHWAAIVDACRCYLCATNYCSDNKYKLSILYIFFHFASAIAMATMTATATATATR